jgi:O-antigen/teichoic acid export membrane protein
MSISLALDRRLSSNALIKFLSELVGRIATFAVAIWAARKLGDSNFGLYSYGLALGFVLAQLADMGLQVLIAREVAFGGYQARPLVRRAIWLKVLFSLPVLLLLWLLTSNRPPDVQITMVVLGAAMLGQTYLEFVAYVFRGRQQLRTEAQLLTGARLLTALLSGLVLALGGGLMGLAASTMAAIGLATLWAGYRLRQAGWLDKGDDARPADQMEPALASANWPLSTLLSQALPLGLATFLSIAYTRLALFMLDYLSGEAAVGQFSAAHRLVEPTQIVPAALLAAVFPAFAASLRSRPDQARSLAWQTSLLLVLGGGLLAAFLWLAAPYLVPRLYGPGYPQTTQILQVLGLATLPAYINYGLTHFLIARGQQLLTSFLMALMLVSHAILSWLLVPRLGAVGPAVSVVAAEGLLFAGCVFILLRKSVAGQMVPRHD